MDCTASPSKILSASASRPLRADDIPLRRTVWYCSQADLNLGSVSCWSLESIVFS